MKKHLITIVAATVIAITCGCHANKATATANDKPALMWIDAEANYERFNNSDTIDKYVDLLASLGFTHLAVDARPITGEVMYDSSLAPRFKGVRNKIEPDSTFDYLQHFIDRAHSRGMKVLFSLNVFCAGHNFFDQGLIFDGFSRWASIVQDPELGMVPITQLKHRSDKYGAMINPINPEYQEYIIDIMKEMTSKYPEVDGLILDRGRYDGIMADFSDLSRHEFEKFIGSKIEHYPDDILKIVKGSNNADSVVRGPLANEWFYWRSKNIYDFFARARHELKTQRPDLIFSTYSGAWYPSYYEVGVNFASADYDPSNTFDWATPKYKETGYAELIDMYITGNYYTDITLDDLKNNPNPIWNETDFEGHSGDWYCIEGSCEHLREILGENKFLGGVLIDQYYYDIERLPDAMAMNVSRSDGLMMFDIVHIINENIWDYIRQGMIKSGYIAN